MHLIIYNVTLSVSKQIHEEWLQWYKSVHIPNVMNSGCFTDCKLYRVVYNDEIDFTYRIHYFCESMNDYTRYETNYANHLKKEHSDKYPQITATRTILQEVKLK